MQTTPDNKKEKSHKDKNPRGFRHNHINFYIFRPVKFKPSTPEEQK